MKLVPMFLFIGAPLALSILINIVFNNLPFIRPLKAKAKLLDDQVVDLPAIDASKLKIKTFRNHQNNGEKIVITQYLVNLTNDTKFKIGMNFWYSIIASMVTVIFVGLVVNQSILSNQNNQNTNVATSPTLQNIQSGNNQNLSQINKNIKNTSKITNQNTSQNTNIVVSPTPVINNQPVTNGSWLNFLDGIYLIGSAVPLFYIVPISMYLLFIQMLFTLWFLFEQINKYKRILED